MAGIEIDGVVVASYAKTADEAAERLSTASSEIGPGTTSYGDLGTQLGVGAAYQRALSALRRQLDDGSDALRSAADSLRDTASRHVSQEDDVIAHVGRAGKAV